MNTQCIAQPEAPAVAAAPAAAVPSIHIRAFVTWLAIFPLVAIGLTVSAPFVQDWHPVLRAFVLTIVLVPIAVYVVVPRLMRVVLSIVRH